MVWFRQSRVTLRDKVKTIKELDIQIVDMLSASKEENVDDQVVKEIEESDEAFAEFQRTLLARTKRAIVDADVTKGRGTKS